MCSIFGACRRIFSRVTPYVKANGFLVANITSCSTATCLSAGGLGAWHGSRTRTASPVIRCHSAGDCLRCGRGYMLQSRCFFPVCRNVRFHVMAGAQVTTEKPRCFRRKEFQAPVLCSVTLFRLKTQFHGFWTQSPVTHGPRAFSGIRLTVLVSRCGLPGGERSPVSCGDRQVHFDVVSPVARQAHRWY